MNTPEANPRLNVSAPLTATPTGNFAIAGTSGVPAPIDAGAAIVATGAVVDAGAAALDAVSQFLNLDVPRGEISGGGDEAAVKAEGELSFSISGAPKAAPAAVIDAAQITAPGAESAASLKLGAPKFTY